MERDIVFLVNFVLVVIALAILIPKLADLIRAMRGK